MCHSVRGRSDFSRYVEVGFDIYAAKKTLHLKYTGNKYAVKSVYRGTVYKIVSSTTFNNIYTGPDINAVSTLNVKYFSTDGAVRDQNINFDFPTVVRNPDHQKNTIIRLHTVTKFSKVQAGLHLSPINLFTERLRQYYADGFYAPTEEDVTQTLAREYGRIFFMETESDVQGTWSSSHVSVPVIFTIRDIEFFDGSDMSVSKFGIPDVTTEEGFNTTKHMLFTMFHSIVTVTYASYINPLKMHYQSSEHLIDYDLVKTYFEDVVNDILEGYISIYEYMEI